MSDPTAFPKFSAELKRHPAAGYHRCLGPVAAEALAPEMRRLFDAPNEILRRFHLEIGPGRFFAGKLSIYAIAASSPGESVPSAIELSKQLDERAGLVAFGYGGVTESCYCLERSGTSDKVYEYFWNAAEWRVHHKDFRTWIESAPKRLFKTASYKCYGEPADPESIRRVIHERGVFSVVLKSFNPELVYKPGEEAILPRYNQVMVVIAKNSPATLSELTIPVRRLGSKVGDLNVEYATVDVSGLMAGESREFSLFVFDPFCVPFTGIEIHHVPQIDLSSRSRGRFKEISQYL